MSVLYLVYGLTSAIRQSAIQSLLVESIPQRWKTLVSSINSLTSGIVLILNTFYIQYISNDYRSYHKIGLAATLISMIALIWVPEGPKYLYNKKGFDECRKSLMVIEKVN